MITISDVKRQWIKDFEGNPKEELLLFLKGEELSSLSSGKTGGCFLLVRGNKALLSVPVFHGELKTFFSDYQNYDYLYAEDRAIHRSVSVYVKKEHKKKATKATAYERHEGDFIPFAAKECEYRLFSRDYHTKPTYIELPEDQHL